MFAALEPDVDGKYSSDENELQVSLEAHAGTGETRSITVGLEALDAGGILAGTMDLKNIGARLKAKMKLGIGAPLSSPDKGCTGATGGAYIDVELDKVPSQGLSLNHKHASLLNHKPSLVCADRFHSCESHLRQWHPRGVGRCSRRRRPC